MKDFTSFVSTNGALRIEAIAFPELIHDTFYGYYEEYQRGSKFAFVMYGLHFTNKAAFIETRQRK